MDGWIIFSLRPQVESTDTTSVVTVPVSLRSHSGRYTITAKNKSGQKHVNVRVNVLGMSECFPLNERLSLVSVVVQGRLTVFISWLQTSPDLQRS